MLACSEFHVRFKYRSTVYRCPGRGSWFYEISEIALLDAFFRWVNEQLNSPRWRSDYGCSWRYTADIRRLQNLRRPLINHLQVMADQVKHVSASDRLEGFSEIQSVLVRKSMIKNHQKPNCISAPLKCRTRPTCIISNNYIIYSGIVNVALLFNWNSFLFYV